MMLTISLPSAPGTEKSKGALSKMPPSVLAPYAGASTLSICR